MQRKLLFSFIFTGALLLAAGLNLPSQRAEAAETNPSLYTVQAGDTLYRVAVNHGLSLSALKGANSLSGDAIYPGQALHLPGVSGGPNIYTVQQSDSLYLISQKYGVTVDALKQNNNMGSSLISPGRVLAIPRSPLADIVKAKGVSPSTLSIFVDKSDHTLSIMSNGKALKAYHVELGEGGLGDKQVQGDRKTPEGNLYITEKIVYSPADEFLGTRWMRLSYPNIEAGERGLAQGLIDQQTYNAIVYANNNGLTPPQETALGGAVGIHGGSSVEFGKDWTYGCVGLSNRDVEEIYPLVSVGTAVHIQK
ncbi:LysM peptidoglycan-binding domain-containing protein [Heliobacterium gestii]|uniref:LysM peptidoglycan-binding domain-containing protein n=1 Tax=Heliomicrobium gestii TaxID=2699 RepID=A0A845LAN5_HELGE|nr:L,D-transpeptidase [Heliomicrobium gestii]MBM7865477.1 LysM repeat protein [Heliomicrobium gestii]MZP41729.1 LysM peptidoglycan-binding domain-containing protein [Heliomicrobium gestii]